MVVNGTYNKKLVRRLLVLLGHGVRSGLGEESDEAEESEAGSEANSHTPGDAGVGTGGVDGTGAVGSKGNPVRCKTEPSQYRYPSNMGQPQAGRAGAPPN